MCYAQNIVLDLNYACNKFGGRYLCRSEFVMAAAMLNFRSDSLLRQRRRKRNLG